MSNPILLQSEFTGMFRDRARDSLPKGKLWNLVDLIPNELGAPLRKRGGWTYHGSALTSLDASAGLPSRMGIVTFGNRNEIRYIRHNMSGGAAADTFTVTFDGQTTGNVAYDDAGGVGLLAALESLANIAPGDVTVTAIDTGDPAQAALLNGYTYGWLIEFKATYAGTNLTQALTITAEDASGDSGTYQEGGNVGQQVVCIDDRANPELFDLTNGVDRGSVYGTSAPAPLGPLVSYRDKLLIPSPALASSPTGPRKYVSSGTISALGGSPPGVRFFCVHKGRLVGASADTDTPNRIFFAGSATDAGDPETWDTTNRWMDTAAPPVALASLGNVLLVYHDGSVERIRGSIPPGSPAANMELEPLWGNVGLISPFALQVQNELVYWADENGVYRSDGSTFTDLTDQIGMRSYWRDQIESVGPGGKVALGVWNGYVWLSLSNGSDDFVDFIMIDIESRGWFRFANIQAHDFAISSGLGDEMYFSNRESQTKRAGKLSTIFDPVNNLLDADSDEIEPVLETPIYDLGVFATKRVRHIYLNYNLEDSASQNPNITFDYVTDPTSLAYSSFGTLYETTERSRRRVPLNRAVNGVGLRVTQTNRSLETSIYGLEADVAVREGSRRLS